METSQKAKEDEQVADWLTIHTPEAVLCIFIIIKDLHSGFKRMLLGLEDGWMDKMLSV